ncbi:MAG: hypothetical protein ACOCUI_02625 [bacterium]
MNLIKGAKNDVDRILNGDAKKNMKKVDDFLDEYGIIFKDL